jgi:hypothetical protein
MAIEDAAAAVSFFYAHKEEFKMIKSVSIQLNQRLICGGLAKVVNEGHEDCIYFDVVKGGSTPRVIVGSRGKRISVEAADQFEKELLELFIKHKVPLQIGTYSVSA